MQNNMPKFIIICYTASAVLNPDVILLYFNIPPRQQQMVKIVETKINDYRNSDWSKYKVPCSI